MIQQMDMLFGKVMELLLVLVKDTDTLGTSYGSESLTAVGNTLFFEGYDSTNGWTLWKSDGTTAGTVMVKDTYTV